jgi:periplasmic protein TonB
MKQIITGLLLVLFLYVPVRLVHAQDTIKTDTTDIVYQIVEEMASFPGGQDSLMKHLANNLRYPPHGNQPPVGIMYVQFVVEKDGSIANIEIKHSSQSSLNQSVIDAVKTFPNWIPGKQQGKPVRTIFILPVQFGLN